MGIDKSTTTIPVDHQIPPTVGYVGFRGAAAQQPPMSWLAQHEIAEAGGFYREGRRWTRSALGTIVRIGCMPVRVLYRSMIDRIGSNGAADLGYTIDA